MTVIENQNDSLEHYGVKGMRWGVRKDRVSTPRHPGKIKSKKKDPNELVNAERKKAYQNRRLLSDAELQSRIKRLEMEKRFRDLSEEDLYRGRKLVKDILVGSGPQALKTISTGAMLYGGKVALTRKVNVADAADYLFPKPKKK